MKSEGKAEGSDMARGGKISFCEIGGMLRCLRRVGAVLFMTLLAASAVPASPLRDTATVAASMHRGTNVLGYDPIWDDPHRARFTMKLFKVIRRGGFDFVRINLQAFGHMDAQDRLPRQWLQTLDIVVSQARAAGLTVILDEHDFNLCSENLETCRRRLGAFWMQVAPRYAKQPDTVLFELLNEPHAALTGDVWNGLLVEMLAIVRNTNPDRTVVIGPTNWNGMAHLPMLRLPESDRHILLTFHYYEPFRFTHQGASWTDLKDLHGVTWGSDADQARLASDFAGIAAWAKAHDRPVLLGEFGAYEGSGTPIEMRAAYTAAVARAAEAQGFSWAHWQFEGGFGEYDIASGQWVGPIKAALVPPSR